MKRLLLLCTLLIGGGVLPVSAIIDSNNNGLSDLWERKFNNGNLFESNFDPNADPDGDGWTNAQEAAAGTNPFDAKEPTGYLRPQIVHIPESWTDLNQDGIDEHTPEAVTITWPTIPGKQYALLYSPNLTDWLPVPDETFIGTGTVVTFGVLMPATDKLFWRVQIEDVDSDGDGLTDAEECELGTDPHNAQTLDGIPDLWLARYFTNTLLAGGLNTIDPNAYANTDGYTIVQAAYLNLDPTTPHIPPTGPIGQQCIVNGDFSQPVIGSSPSNTSDPTWDYWGPGAVPGWSAVVGTNIEFQNITPKETGNPYVELKAEPAGHYGIQQEVGTSKGATYLLMLDCRDRPDVGPECSNFNVLIDGEIKCKINFSAPTATTPPDKFVAPSAWTTVAVPFTATRPITLISLVPVNTLDDITGCLVDNVNLLPVEVVVRKKAESTAPATGLLVKKGDMITFDINGAAPASEFPLPPETVKWKLRQLKHDGTTTNWTDVSGQGPELDFTTNESGVFEAKAVLTPQGGQAQDFPLTRKKDAPHADSSAGVVQEFHKAGAVDYFGVADAQWQIDLRNTALGNLGSDYYKNEGECVVQGSTTAPNPSNKCNIFIYHKCGDAGAPVPLTRGGIPGWRTGPPLAIDWWNDNSGRTDDAGRTITSFDIPNWSRLPDATMPQPGLVVAHPSLAGNPDQYSSHVGIFDYDGSWISAGFAKVNKYYHPKTVTSDGPYQPQSYRKFTGGNQP